MEDDARPRWVIVSGAGGALGAALARRYAQAGRAVLALDQDAERLDALAEAGIMTRTIDLCDAAAVEAALAAAIQPREAISLLVNAVGLIWNEPVLAFKGVRLQTHAAESFARVMQANVLAAFVTASRVAQRMARTGGGAIVNFSSISAGGNPGQTAYAAAKAAIEGMTRAMAQEIGPLGVRVNAVAPGFIDVPSTQAAVSAEMLEGYMRRTPLSRLGQVEELAQAIESLESNTFLNGVILPVDGGLRL